MLIIKRLKVVFSYLLNRIVPKKRAIYVRCMDNSYHDKYDIINCNSSNLLKVINRITTKTQKEMLYIYLEYNDESRLELYKRFSSNVRKNNIKLHFLKAFKKEDKGLLKYLNRLCNAIKRFSCVLWLSESGDYPFDGKLKNQVVLCMNYFISCKNDYVHGKDRRWEYLDYLLTTALLPSQILSASVGVHLDSCIITGFPRNDTLNESNKTEKVWDWIVEKTGHRPKYVLVYAPTFRDYEDKQVDDRWLMGYPCNELEEVLLSLDAVLIFKLHPLQKSNIVQHEICMIPYETTYDFSFYDLLSVSTCLIGDYSSLNFDYLLTKKPLIFNLYDFERYKEARGLSYEPYLDFCPGIIINNQDELIKAILSLNKENSFTFHENKRILRLMHKYTDFCATDRVVSLIEDILKY